MKRSLPALAVALLLFAPALPSRAEDKKEPGRVVITTYRAAPGKQLELLKWLSARDEVAREAGVAPTQMYTHLDGDSWDFISIGPVPTAEQDKKQDEIAKKKGLKIGFAAALEFRALIASHTDTTSMGPMSAAEIAASAR